MQMLLIQFPGRRYHATPWGHHVNEGLVEWPPSPWRLLRALLATGYTTGLWTGEGPPALARSLIGKLAGTLPTYRLPRAVGAHSRHYMPIGTLKGGLERTTLVFDTWAHVDEGALAVLWDVELSPDETTLLANLAAHLGYLGRSESWIAARLAHPAEVLPEGEDCCPSEAPPAPGWEQVPLMAAQDEDSYAQWRRDAIAQAVLGLPEGDRVKRKLTKEERAALAQRERIEALYPPDLLACLQVETSWLQKHGWSQPPGSRRVFYWRPAHCLEPGALRRRLSPPGAASVEAMLLSMTTTSGNNHALPSIVRTLPQAEMLHRALVSFATRSGSNASCAVLIGCDEGGKPLRGPHEHAHLLPLDLDGDDHLDHILIWAPIGLNSAAQSAVRSVRRTYTKGGIGPLRLALVGAGRLEELCRLPGTFGLRLRSVIGSRDGETEWISETPFVPPRHLKRTGNNTLTGQVKAELASRGLPEPLEIRILDPHEDIRSLLQRHFIRSRRYGSEAPIDCGFSMALRFEKPAKGPICLGYGSHFGLGRLVVPRKTSEKA